MAKLFASETGRMCAEECLRIHGGYGYSKEYEIERIYRDAPLLLIGEGTSEIQRMVIGRKLLQRHKRPLAARYGLGRQARQGAEDHARTHRITRDHLPPPARRSLAVIALGVAFGLAPQASSRQTLVHAFLAKDGTPSSPATTAAPRSSRPSRSAARRG